MAPFRSTDYLIGKVSLTITAMLCQRLGLLSRGLGGLDPKVA
jgi:hypothetical protein